MTRCLFDQKSILWPSADLWTPSNFEHLIESYVKKPDDRDTSFFAKLENQITACPPSSVALMAEIYWAVQLAPTNLKSATKADNVKLIWQFNPFEDFPDDSEFLQQEVLAGLGSAGPGYNNYIAKEISYAIQAFCNFSLKNKHERERLLGDGFAFAEWFSTAPGSEGRQLYNTLCHAIFPDNFERIFSKTQKFQVARAHKIFSSEFDTNRVSLDKALLELRARLEQKHNTPIDYYCEPVPTLLAEPKEKKSQPSVGIDTAGEELPPAAEKSDEVVSEADNIIYSGPPGTGKTFMMQEAMRKCYEAGNDFELLSFHPSLSYEEFVGGLRPVSENGGTSLVFKKGPFIELCERAHEDPTRRFTLFIDEINRGNVAKIFGELITLLEPSKRVRPGSSPGEDHDGLWIRIPGCPELLGVPSNLDIVATMNSADRSIAPIDFALRRRFRFIEFTAAPEKIRPESVGSIDLRKLLTRINSRLELLLDREHVIGHSYFFGISSIEELRSTFSERIIPLLLEYFFDDLEKVELVLSGTQRTNSFIAKKKLDARALFHSSASHLSGLERTSYEIGNSREWVESDFTSIYEDKNLANLVNHPGELS